MISVLQNWRALKFLNKWALFRVWIANVPLEYQTETPEVAEKEKLSWRECKRNVKVLPLGSIYRWDCWARLPLVLQTYKKRYGILSKEVYYRLPSPAQRLIKATLCPFSGNRAFGRVFEVFIKIVVHGDVLLQLWVGVFSIAIGFFDS